MKKAMSILFLTNSDVSMPLSNWLTEQGHNVHITGNAISARDVGDLKTELIISYCYNKIVKKDVIEAVRGNIVNLHTAYLPWNRGASPNYWSFVDNTPKGVTLHYINEGVDTGDIISRALVELSTEQTFSETYNLLHEAMRKLFCTAFDQYSHWREIAFHPGQMGTYHSKNDLHKAIGNAFDWNVKISDYKKLVGLT